jgi:hypothetical protein
MIEPSDNATENKMICDNDPGDETDICVVCGMLQTLWCCSPDPNGGPPWITLQFYDRPLSSFRVIEHGEHSFAEIRELTFNDSFNYVTLDSHDIKRISEKLGEVIKGK